MLALHWLTVEASALSLGEQTVTSRMATRSTSPNARMAAVTLAFAAFLTLLLTHTSMALAPLRILAASIAAFAVWSFCAEMGLHKPLNRAGFVLFAIAVMAKVSIALGVEPQFVGRYSLMYSAFLLLAILFWSVAFLHRQRELKWAGAVGVFATAAPVAALVVGHLVVGFGAAVGIESLMASTDGGQLEDFRFVAMVERIFGLWAYLAAWFLWRGYIDRTQTSTLQSA
jgi:hypothetical protein